MPYEAIKNSCIRLSSDYIILNTSGFLMSPSIVQLADVVLPMPDFDYTDNTRRMFDKAIDMRKPILSRMVLAKQYQPARRRYNIHKRIKCMSN